MVVIPPPPLPRLQDVVELVYGFDEVVIVPLAVRTDGRTTVVAEELYLRIGERPLAAAARETGGAARHGSEDVVGVHRSDDQGRSAPLLLAELALERPLASDHAAEADGVHVEVALSVELHSQVGVVAARRQEEGSVDQRVLVEDWHRVPADDTVDGGDVAAAERHEDEGPRLVVAELTLVLQLDVVGVAQADRKVLEDGEVVSVSEDVPCGRLDGAREEARRRRLRKEGHDRVVRFGRRRRRV